MGLNRRGGSEAEDAFLPLHSIYKDSACLRPGGLGILQVRMWLLRWIHRDQVFFLPLKQVRERKCVLPVSSELYRPLERSVCASAKNTHDFRIIETLGLVDALFQDLPNGERLDGVRADTGSIATEFFNESRDKVIVLEGLDRRPPPIVRDEDSLRAVLPHCAGKC